MLRSELGFEATDVPTKTTTTPLLVHSTAPPTEEPTEPRAEPMEPKAPPTPLCKARECYCVSAGGETCDGVECQPDQCTDAFICPGHGYWCRDSKASPH